jgi:Domain of unknown function (DUF4406)
MSFRAKIYIAGPYSNGDPESNVDKAIETANTIADLGFAPYVPHFTHFWEMRFHRDYEFWLDLDNQFLPCCDAVLRIPGKSSGADKEVELAKRLGKPVFTSIQELEEHYGR